MKQKELAIKLLSEVEKLFPEATTELANWKNDFQFLVAVILSAQTTDIQVNKATVELFRKYPDAAKLSKAKMEDLEYSLGGINYFRTMVVASFANSKINSNDRVRLFKTIEKTIFLFFRMGQYRSNWRSSETYNRARELLNGEVNIEDLISELQENYAPIYKFRFYLKNDEDIKKLIALIEDTNAQINNGQY